MADAPHPAVVADLAPAGVLRASINLGNPVLAQGPAEAPAGVTVDLARELATRLGVPVAFTCFDGARKSFEALKADAADVAFLAIEPARAAEVSFTEPYVVIEGVYAVPESSPLTTASEVDSPGVRIAVNEGSAYDLFLTRTLEHAELVRGPSGVEVFEAQGLEAVASVRQPLAQYVSGRAGVRLMEPRFMEIRQAVATTKERSDATLAFLHDEVEALKAGGFVAAALVRSGQEAIVPGS